MLFTLPLFLALQTAPASQSTPPSGDTAAYWQQEVRYRITARLDEDRSAAVATGALTYINHSPDTLREMYFHQHLNAFRPHSAWSEVDTREGRVRFQNLEDPHYAYERFTAPPRVRRFAGGALGAGTNVMVEYPGAPDSTVAHIRLPEPLLPGDSLVIELAWEARPSTLPRRQGRRGRHYDFAQWYPRVAVYDRLGWRPNPLVPAGEFYGEFGTYDVTLVLRDDQVVGATGVVVEGDPGWTRARRWGVVHAQPDAYGAVPALPAGAAPAGHRRVRFLAENVHHFAWSTSPDYRYEGGTYVRPRRMLEPLFPTWDTVAVHVLYQPGDEQSWGNGAVVQRTMQAAQWLESVFGPYAYPQITVLHRIEGGGTEFPMMQMNGSPGLGLNLHEFGHVFIHGILANNEWAAGWIDEGLSSYQTSWAQRFTPQDRTHPNFPEFGAPEGYRGRAVLPDPLEAGQIGEYELLHTGRAEPIGTYAHEFNEFGIYNSMIYGRGSTMWGQLRDILGEDGFRAMLNNLYQRYTYRHVDELAIRLEAERVHGSDLGWFFEQWVHRTGLIDYALRDVDTERSGDGWVTRARIERIGSYRHAMPVGARTAEGWTIVRADPAVDEQTVEIRTAAEPLEVRLDPHRSTDDWDRRNDIARPSVFESLTFRRADTKLTFDWPFLQQLDRERLVIEMAPTAWTAQGPVVGLHLNENYQGWIDRVHLDFAVELGDDIEMDPDATGWDRVQLWSRMENPTWFGRVMDGLRIDLAWLDAITHGAVQQEWDVSRFLFTTTAQRTLSLGLSATSPGRTAFLPEQWQRADTYEASLRFTHRTQGASRTTLQAALQFGAARATVGDDDELRWYPRVEASADRLITMARGRVALFGRLYGGLTSEDAPFQRAIFLSSADPISTLSNHWWRPRDALLKGNDAHFVPLGGGALRGYHYLIGAEKLLAANLEAAVRVVSFAPWQQSLGLWVSAFTDQGRLWIDDDGVPVGDAGLGLSVRGRLYDRDVRLRVDFPLYVRHPEAALAEPGDDKVAFRWQFSLADLW